MNSIKHEHSCKILYLAILGLHVALIAHAKFQFNQTYSLGDVF